MELNREQIIKALECCASGNSVSACMSGCPIYEKEYCECIEDDTALLKYALALIRELTEEVEYLETEKEHLDLVVEGKMKRIRALEKMVLKLTDKCKGLEAHLDVSVSEQARLAEKNENLNASCTELTRKCASLNDEVERLENELARAYQAVDESTEFTCVFGQPHKVSNCPIDDEIAHARADTVREMAERWKERLPQLLMDCPYLDVLNEEFWLEAAYELFEGIDQITKEMLEETK